MCGRFQDGFTCGDVAAPEQSYVKHLYVGRSARPPMDFKYSFCLSDCTFRCVRFQGAVVCTYVAVTQQLQDKRLDGGRQIALIRSLRILSFLLRSDHGLRWCALIVRIRG